MPDELRLNRKISNLGIGQHSRKRLDNNRLIGADARAEGKKYISADISTILNKNRIHQPMQFGGSFTSESQVVEYLSNIVRPYNSMGTHLCRLDDPPCIEGSEWVDIHSIPQKKRIKDNIEKMSKNTAMEEERLEKERLEKEKQEKERLEKERLEKERLEKERLEKERLEKERLEKEKLEKERLEKERLEKEKLEKERLEKERLEKERLEKERLEKEKLEKERLEKERLEKEKLDKEREKLEIYLFNFYHTATLEFIVNKYKQIYPEAVIKVYDNYTMTQEEQDKISLLDCEVINYGSPDTDLDYQLLPSLYNSVWRSSDSKESWVIIAPADVLVYVTPGKIKKLNQESRSVANIRHYNMVSKSTKKDLSDIQIKTVNTACEITKQSVACFNKSLSANIGYNPSLDAIEVSDVKYIEDDDSQFNAYTYKYMGLAFYINRSRLLYARQNKWRDESYKICSSKDINTISSEILSLPQTTNLSTLK